MSRIILPASAQYNVERERMAVRHHNLKDFDRQLRELDEHAELVQASEYADAPGIVPGFWHVRRTDPDTGWQAYIALKGPHGEFSEPHSGHLEMLRENDLQAPGGFERLMRRVEAEERERDRHNMWTRDEFKQEFAERYLNKERPSVSFSDVGGWRNKAHARRG